MASFFSSFQELEVNFKKITNYYDNKDLYAEAFVFCSIVGWGDYAKTSKDYKICAHATSIRDGSWAAESWEDYGFRVFRCLK